MIQLTQQQSGAAYSLPRPERPAAARRHARGAARAGGCAAKELLWGSVTLAVRGVALSRGDEIEDRQAVEQYAQNLGREYNDRRIRDAFSRLSSFADAADRVRESRAGAQHLVAVLEDVTLGG